MPAPESLKAKLEAQKEREQGGGGLNLRLMPEGCLTMAIQEKVKVAADDERVAFQPPTIPEQAIHDLWKAVNSGEDGDAWLFIQLHRDKLVFDHAAGTWYGWGGHSWQEDYVAENVVAVNAVTDAYGEAAQREASRRLKASRDGVAEEAKEAEGREKAYLGRVKELQKLHRKRNVLTLSAAGRRSLGISGEEWDQHPWLLACPNGTIDLQTGKLRPGRQEDYLKTTCPTAWRDLDAKAPAWLQFVTEIMDGDQELTGYLQRLLGYSITGLSTEHVFPILYGNRGRNGKGTLLQTLADVLGPLAGPVKSEMLLDQSRTRSSASPDSDIMALRGKRLVWASETDEGRKLNAGKVKWLVGGDILCGREPFGRREVHFKPTHTLLLLTNHKPKADPTDYALWQRVHLIPFALSFVDEPRRENERRRDPQLTERLRAESSGILAWLVRGCLDWQRDELKPPDTVKAATEQYRQDEDLLGHFIGECCLISAAESVKAGQLYKAYQSWCEEMGHKPISGTRFGKEMKERFRWAEGRHVVYSGIGVMASNAPLAPLAVLLQ